ncbi:MAG: response regulator [Chloroflexota bacterium]
MSKGSILVVEDDFDISNMLKIYFSGQGYAVEVAGKGGDAISSTRKQLPNLIVLDINLPDMSGYDVCRELRTTTRTKHIPIIFLTQKDERSDKITGLELGADDYITKPFDIDELRLRVEGGIRRATRENLHEVRTGLPTGPLIAEERKKRPDANELVFRLQGFKAYSDVYSFMAADDVLFHAGKTIRDVLSNLGHNYTFVGIQDDEFVIITDVNDLTMLEERIASDFAGKVTTFYSFKDAERKGIIKETAEGEKEFYPLMTLTTAADDFAPVPAPDEDDEDTSNVFDW